MTKWVLLALFSYLPQAIAFETGDYHGESQNQQQICDFNIIQNPRSLTIKKFECIDKKINFQTNDEYLTLRFGRHEQKFPSDDLVIITELSADSLIYTIKALSTPDRVTETFISTSPGVIHFNLVLFNKKEGERTYFDLELFKK